VKICKDKIMLANKIRNVRFQRTPLLQTSSLSFQSKPFATQSKAKIPMNNNLIGMIEWFRRNGYKMAKTDPLEMQTQ
jgi:2-oxoglutarate dehydrogenase complex dehydrogenase (E1) component-like enzyme